MDDINMCMAVILFVATDWKIIIEDFSSNQSLSRYLVRRISNFKKIKKFFLKFLKIFLKYY